jgi:PAS domain S-box-containing protein
MTQAVILTGFIVLLLTTLSFLIARSILEQSVLSQLSSVAAISEDALEQTLQAHRERASLLSAHTDIRSLLRGGALRTALSQLFEQMRRAEPSLAGVEVYDSTGRMLDSVGEGAGLPDDVMATPQYRTVTDESGWRWYDVRMPVWVDGHISGYLTLRYDAQPLIARFTAVAPSLGSGSQVLLIRSENGEVQLLHLAQESDTSYILSLGSVTDATLMAMPWLSSLKGEEGVIRSSDEKGTDMLIAYRYLPTLGWGMAFLVDREVALVQVRTLAFTHAAIGTLLLFLSALLAWFLARQLTQPLRSLTQRVQHLQPGSWTMHRLVHTGDEVELLENMLVDMAGRLQNVYQSQEREIRQRTEELRHQYALDRTILDTIEYGLITVDRKGHITGINRAGLLLLGEKSEHVLGTPVQNVLRICGHRGELLKGAHPLLQCMKTGHVQKAPVSAHFNVRRDDDTLLPVLYTVSPFSTGKKIAGAVMVFQDVTEERKVDYLKSEFISLASHQLRTPLSALRWYTELLSDTSAHLNTDQREYVRQMKTSLERMNTLLMSLLSASRMETQEVRPSVVDTDINALLHELLGDFQPLVQEAGLKSALALPHKAVHISTDPTLLRIVLQNLLNNAVKYSVKNSKETVVLELTEKASGITFVVRDEGIGIPSEEQKRIFQKFFRAKNVRKIDTDGNGLGLYITKTIIERLGGTIHFKSTENKGSVFTVTLPKGKKGSKK